MLTVLRQRLAKDDEDGFTLIELMVVVLIIAILIAIAIPTFLGAQDRARDRGAQSDLRNGLTAAKTLATDAEGMFLDSGGAVINAADLSGVEGAVDFSDAAADVNDAIVVETTAAPVAGSSILLYHRSASDKYFGIQSTSDGDVTYCKGALADVDGTNPCDDAKW
jgi:type IV pilus assembly protein PilA